MGFRFPGAGIRGAMSGMKARLTVVSSLAAVLTAAAVEPAAVEVDFSVRTGAVNPLLHCSGYGPRSDPRGLVNDDAALQALNLQACRTHDWALVNPGQRIIDTQYIFPLFHLDPKEPANYLFEPTDRVLSLARGIGMKVFYRMGTSIEHTGDDWGCNTLNPPDHAAYAEMLAGIVRHYNKGWAKGFQWGIEYWELFNEPNIRACWRGTKAEFIDLFVTCLGRLKSEFPEIKVGGPAFGGCPVDYMEEILRACGNAGVKPDFLSWHYYGQDPGELAAQPAQVRALVDSHGLKDCELIINEWHYILTWDGIHGASSPEKVRQAHEGPSGHLNIDSAAFNLAVLAKLENTPLDQAYYYGLGGDGNWGYMTAGAFNKCYHSLKLFGGIVAGYQEKVQVAAGKESLAPFAALAADGRKGCLLVTDYRGNTGDITVAVKGMNDAQKVSAVVLDHTRDLAPVDVAFAGSRLTLPRNDGHSAAFLVTFER